MYLAARVCDRQENEKNFKYLFDVMKVLGGVLSLTSKVLTGVSHIRAYGIITILLQQCTRHLSAPLHHAGQFKQLDPLLYCNFQFSGRYFLLSNDVTGVLTGYFDTSPEIGICFEGMESKTGFPVTQGVYIG